MTQGALLGKNFTSDMICLGLAEVEDGWPAGQGHETKLENLQELVELLKQSSSRSLGSFASFDL